MNKSDIYKLAMAAVISNDGIEMGEKIEILEVLMGDMKMARFSEELKEAEA